MISRYAGTIRRSLARHEDYGLASLNMSIEHLNGQDRRERHLDIRARRANRQVA